MLLNPSIFGKRTFIFGKRTVSRSTVHDGRENHLLHLVIYFFLYAPYDYVVLRMLQKSDMSLINIDMCLEEQSSYQIDWQRHLWFHFLLQHAVVTHVLETEGHSLVFSVFVGAFDMDSIADIPWRAKIPYLFAFWTHACDGCILWQHTWSSNGQ